MYLSKTHNPVPTSNSESVLPKGEGFLSICPRRRELILQKQSEANKSLPEISHRRVGSLKGGSHTFSFKPAMIVTIVTIVATIVDCFVATEP